MRGSSLAATLALACSASRAVAQHAVVLPPREAPETRLQPDTGMVLVGSGMLAVPYSGGVAYAALEDDSPRGMDHRYLYVPIVGPLLAIRGVGCDDGDASCSTAGGQRVWALLLLDSIVQATGATLLTVGLLNAEPVHHRDASPRIWLTPHATRGAGYGVSVGAAY